MLQKNEAKDFSHITAEIQSWALTVLSFPIAAEDIVSNNFTEKRRRWIKKKAFKKRKKEWLNSRVLQDILRINHFT